MTPSFEKVQEWRNVDLGVFREQIVPGNQPAVLRGLIGDWPAVREGLKSSGALVDYLRRFDTGRSVQVYVGDASINGRFFYTDDLQGFNFQRAQEPIGASLGRLLDHLNDPSPPSIYIQSAPIPDCLPGFGDENSLGLVKRSVVPRIWIGNAISVSAHFDLSDNIACVVGGRRRFTLFPPEQLANLYVGPLEFTIAGPPVSMVSLDDPDLERYPRFREALAAAKVAELEPGDAIYIPYFWWHHVRSLERFNVLVNYWWNDAAPAVMGSPFDCMLHALLSLRDLPENQRAAWRAVFDYYVFKTHGDPVAHLAPDQRGTLGPMTPEHARRMGLTLLNSLARSLGVQPAN